MKVWLLSCLEKIAFLHDSHDNKTRESVWPQFKEICSFCTSQTKAWEFYPGCARILTDDLTVFVQRRPKISKYVSKNSWVPALETRTRIWRNTVIHMAFPFLHCFGFTSFQNMCPLWLYLGNFFRCENLVNSGEKAWDQCFRCAGVWLAPPVNLIINRKLTRIWKIHIHYCER